MFFSISVLFLLCLYVLTRRLALGGRLAIVIFLVIVFGFIVWTLPINLRSETPIWYHTSPYKHTIALLFMLLGMAGKYFFDAIERRRKKRRNGQLDAKLEFDRWEFFQPFIISFIIFGTFWSAHGKEELTMSYLIISFQNGFFWETVLNKRE